MTKRAARRDLTAKQEKFISAYADPASPDFGNATCAARSAGYKGEVNALGVQGHENLKNPKITAAIQELLNAADATPELATQRLAESMSASTVRVFLTKKEKLIYSRPLPNFAERRAAAMVVLRLHGLTDPPPKQLSEPNFEDPGVPPLVELPLIGLAADPVLREAAREIARLSPQDRMLMREGYTAIENLLKLMDSDPELCQRYAGKSVAEILADSRGFEVKTDKG